MNKKRTLLTTLLLTSVALLLFSWISPGTAFQDQHEFSHGLSYQMDEYTEFSSQIDETTGVNLTLPSDSWNLTEINMSFTGIKENQEIKVIEELGNTYEQIDKVDPAWGIQINITEPTVLIGVEINVYLSLGFNSTAYVQINGYNITYNCPNATIYGEQVTLNASAVPNWYIQYFPSPISLDPGYYFLVVNATNINPGERIFWYYNDTSPLYSDLYVAKYDDPDWSDEGTGKVFNHRLIQRPDINYYPEDINMSVEVGGVDYSVTDGMEIGNGSVNITTNLFPNASSYDISIKSNLSSELFFNVSYHIKISHRVNSNGSVLIRAGSSNLWTLDPTLTHIGHNYSATFSIPSSWHDLKVYNSSLDITSSVNITGGILTIPNDTVSSTTEFLINATSPRIPFTLNFPVSDFKPEQELNIEAYAPNTQGYLIFDLYNPLGFEKKSESFEVQEASTLFSYDIPTSPYEGEGKIFIYW
ncbi:MAG: hypothetical protein ACFFCS_29670, partial [Candidatus Hodarchaeota archaeon]